MNSNERTMRRLTGEAVDRVPNFDIFMAFAARRIGRPLRSYYLDYRVLVEANLRMVEEFDVDIVQAISDPYRETSDFGAEIEFPEDGLPVSTKPLLENHRNLRALSRPDPGTAPRMRDRLEAIRLMLEQVKGFVPIMGWVEGALAQAGDLRGVSALLTDMVDRPGWVEELLEKCAEVEIVFARMQVEAGADIIGLGDALASQISPHMYRQYALPYEQRIFGAVRSAGALGRLHICGNTTWLLPDMVMSGADMIDLDWMVDWREAHRMFPGRVAFCGNVDPVGVMLQGNPEAVFQGILQCLRQGDAQCFSAAGCEIPPGTPPENLRAQSRALRQWGAGGGQRE